MTIMRWNRREFMRAGMIGSGTSALAAGGVSAVEKAAEKPAPAKMPTRMLGRTKLPVSQIGLGSYGFSASDVFNAALDVGINFVQTCADYQQGNAERALGKILEKRRKEVVIATGSTLRANTTKAQILEWLDRSLERLKIQNVDILLTHMANTLGQVQNPAIFEAFEEAKKAKKATFLGVTSHGGEMVKVVEFAAECGKYDVVMCKYNFMEAEGLEAALKKAADQKMGIAVFKATAGSREKELADYTGKGLTQEQATVRWVLRNPSVASVLRPFSKFEDVKDALETMARPFGAEEAALLERYRAAFDRQYCRYCGTCEAHCPFGVAVAEVMRYAMYFKYYGREKDSMQLYAALDPAAQAAPCESCPGYCEQACPHQVRVRPQLVEAHGILSWTA